MRWKRSATPANRSWWVLTTLEQTTRESGSGSLLSTPRKSDMQAGGHGDTGRMGTVRHILRSAEMLPTPLATDGAGTGGGSTFYLRRELGALRKNTMFPTPTKRDGRMDKWSPAYDRRKSPTMDAIMDGAAKSLTPTAKGNLTAPSMQKWAGARALAAMLQNHGLTGTAALPITYGWMMGYPPGWLSIAALQAPLSRLLATPSSRKSRKP